MMGGSMKKESKLYLFRDRSDYIKVITSDNIFNVTGEKGSGKSFFGNMKDELDTIAKCLEDDDWGVKLAAIQALGDLASDEAIKLIKDARKSEDDKDFKKSCNKAIKKAEKRQKAKASGESIVKVIPMSTIKEMEKTNPQKAIKEYERYVEAKQPKDAAYKRLCVLYRKDNDYENEVRVIETAIGVFADNEKKLPYFEKRLAKLK